MARITPMQGPLVTGGNVMDKTSNKVPKRKPFVHPMLAESLSSKSVNRGNVNRAIQSAIVSHRRKSKYNF